MTDDPMDKLLRHPHLDRMMENAQGTKEGIAKRVLRLGHLRLLANTLELLTGPSEAVDEQLFELHHNRKRQRLTPSETLPAYTSSLDAAVALAGTILPDAQWTLRRQHGLSTAVVYKFVAYNGEALNLKADPAIALCRATIRALIDKETKS